MSKNLTQLARRKGIDNTLFQQLVVGEDSHSKAKRNALAKDFLIGEAIVYGTASFYDFIDGANANKKAYVCNGSSCLCAGTQDRVKEQLLTEFDEQEIGHVTCLGRCSENSAFQINKINYSGNNIEQLSHILSDSNFTSAEHYHVECLMAEAMLTANIDNPSEYYQLFTQLQTTETPQQTLDKISQSGLRGRGGAGFPTGFKWQSCRDIAAQEKYIVCNADEGDAGAYSDRYLLEQRPHAVLFGMLMAGYLVGASTGVLYIRDEYPAAISACEQAIKEYTALNLPIDFTFKIIRGAGAYICGEETALLRSIEGQRPLVSVRPPFPTESGLFGCPTVLNNVETFAAIHWILDGNEARYQAIGNGKSTGSKLISLDSSFNKPGIYEVAMGTPLEQVFKRAGGFARPLKALQIGGPLGGVVPIEKISQLSVDFESFAQQGFLLGHASVIGIPENIRMIDYLEHLFEFTAAESCGKCYPCQLGSVRGQEIIQHAKQGDDAIDMNLLSDLLETMELGSLCALGGGVPLPIKNILQYFSDEISPYVKTDADEHTQQAINDGGQAHD
ncbi:NADH-ubiquinone oxidoreductase-F iron-sulfur binding region domain-containing protein [Thalassotalea sp. G2M2-11]|uniref:NADH-ubiquinone oxidoreductase-F iron-sulfur binding region domain-containing protein n=1 Tax=Thalassotalea sp. G2M2-11 TaxID=2787627 RepID=UPI0019D2BA50|nr:NADH-ubiquinone oxidoreductase-F iron-sulfur binding region domain-containing protein [Thalassotalea sp. G2M2-11]